MKTDELITLLASGAGPAPRAVAARRLLPVAFGGAAIAALAAVWTLGLVPAPMFATPAMWTKLGYAALLVLAGGWLAARLGRPVPRTGAPLAAVAAVFAVIALLGAASLAALPAGERMGAWLGHSWRTCPGNVLLLSLPALAGALWALRGLAPTRPRAAGAAAGLFAGAVGALGYGLSCEELSAGFVATWYTLGIALATALGAALGPRWLRW